MGFLSIQHSSGERIAASAQWVRHFELSLARADIVRDDALVVLTDAERAAIASSVQ
jgi:hypothetical protein